VENQTINLAFGQGNTLIKMAEFVGKAVGKEPKITIAPPLLGEVTHYVADITKARELLGYEPKVPLEEGIPRTVAWNREWEEKRET
jgi:UDP-glucuronate 4-epimerase